MSFSQAIYDEAITNGASPLFADMLAHQQAPGTKGTDRAFLEGRFNNNEIGSMMPWMQQGFKKKLDDAGVSAAGKVYMSSLVRKEVGPGDPFAYVSDLAEAKAKCLSLGRDGWGIATVKAPEKPPTPDIPLAEDIVMEQVAREVAKNPDLRKNLGEVRHNVIEKHAPKWGQGGTKNFLKQVKVRKDA